MRVVCRYKIVSSGKTITALFYIRALHYIYIDEATSEHLYIALRYRSKQRMAALIVGHGFVRRLKRWMVENGKEMSVRNHKVHLHGVGGRSLRQVYDMDLSVVRRLRPGVIFFSSEEMTS
jgi:hypothetical protein